MTMKPNPGCEIPQIPLPPSVQSFVDNLAKDAIASAAKYLIPASGKATYLIDKAIAVKEQAELLTKQAQERLDLLNKYQKRLEEYAKIPCPLPPVSDKAATSK